MKVKGSGGFKKQKILELSGQSILDVGCSFGKFSLFARDAGKEVVGVDKNIESLYEAHKAGISVIAGDAAALPFPNKSFDTVLLFDIIEHTKEEIAVLQEAKRVARKNILLSVPKSDEYSRHDAGVTYHSYFDPTHLRYYTQESLKKALKKSGFERFSIEYFSRVRPLLFYRRIGIPVFLLKVADIILWTVGKKTEHFYQTLFAEIRLD
ncbi:MAG: class I SAM-dependent methyltransferase [Planctomycetota bacterium]|nr:class I SAM-dependent methyltransferase [Planctomycetota bacterium]